MKSLRIVGNAWSTAVAASTSSSDASITSMVSPLSSVRVCVSVIVRVRSSVLNVFVSTRYNDDVFVGSSVNVVVIEFSGVWVPVSVRSSVRVCVCVRHR